MDLFGKDDGDLLGMAQDLIQKNGGLQGMLGGLLKGGLGGLFG